MVTPNASQFKDTAHTTLEAIKEDLGVSSIQDFSIVLWMNPRKRVPEDGSYLIIKERDPELGIVCSEASFENGAFWYAQPFVSEPIPLRNILAWAYMPYDDRLQNPD